MLVKRLPTPSKFILDLKESVSSLLSEIEGLKNKSLLINTAISNHKLTEIPPIDIPPWLYQPYESVVLQWMDTGDIHKALIALMDGIKKNLFGGFASSDSSVLSIENLVTQINEQLDELQTQISVNKVVSDASASTLNLKKCWRNLAIFDWEVDWNEQSGLDDGLVGPTWTAG